MGSQHKARPASSSLLHCSIPLAFITLYSTQMAKEPPRTPTELAFQFPDQDTTPTSQSTTAVPPQVVTPVQRIAQDDISVQSTPSNHQGTASRAEFQHINVYAPYFQCFRFDSFTYRQRALTAAMARDVQNFQECKAEAMLRTFLGFVTEDSQELSLETVLLEVLDIANDEGVHKQLEK
jgi:hypothetical protein